MPLLSRPWRRPVLAPTLLVCVLGATACESDGSLASPDAEQAVESPELASAGGRKNGSIGGTVSSPVLGPIAGARPTLAPGGQSTTTGAAGTYLFSKLAAGAYSVSLTATPASCFRAPARSVTVQSGSTAQADFTLACRRIAYTRASAAGFQIHTVNPDGGDTPITSGPAGASDPSWSPDGSRLAFSRGGEVWVMDRTGANATQLTTGAIAGRPAWSPDGSRIAYVSFANGRTDLWVMAANGSGQSNLTATSTISEDDPAWSPDGTRLLFSQGGDIWVMNATPGSTPSKLTTNPFSDTDPDWSPDGTRIVYAAASMADDGEGSADVTYEIWVMNADGSSPVKLTSDANPDWEPNWSPDGSRIVWTGLRPGTGQLFTMPAAGGAQTPLAAPVAEGADW